MAVRDASPSKTVEALIAHAKANTEVVSVGTAGVGTPGWQDAAKAEWLHVGQKSEKLSYHTDAPHVHRLQCTVMSSEWFRT